MLGDGQGWEGQPIALLVNFCFCRRIFAHSSGPPDTEFAAFLIAFPIFMDPRVVLAPSHHKGRVEVGG